MDPEPDGVEQHPLDEVDIPMSFVVKGDTKNRNNEDNSKNTAKSIFNSNKRGNRGYDRKSNNITISIYSKHKEFNLIYLTKRRELKLLFGELIQEIIQHMYLT